MSHGTHTRESWHAYEWVMARIWARHGMQVGGAHMNESWPTYIWVIARVWMSPSEHMDTSWHAHESVLAHTWLSHGARINMHDTHINESRYTYEWMSQDININESCRTYKWVTPNKHETIKSLSIQGLLVQKKKPPKKNGNRLFVGSDFSY